MIDGNGVPACPGKTRILTVCIDQDLDIKTEVQVAAGTSVQSLKEKLTAGDLCGQINISTFSFRMPGSQTCLGDETVLPEDCSELELVEGQEQPTDQKCPEPDDLPAGGSSTNVLIIKVKKLLNEGRPNRAEDVAAEALADKPSAQIADELHTLRLEALLHPAFENPGTGEAVLQLARKLVAEQANSIPRQILLGRALCCAGQRDEAQLIWRQASEVEGQQGPAASLLCALGKVEQIKAVGNGAFKAGQWTEAAKAYTQALEADEMRTDREVMSAVLGNRSAARRKLMQLDGALCDAEESMRLSPTYTKARYRRALAFMELGRYSEALTDLRSCKAKDPAIAGLDEWLLRAENWSRRCQSTGKPSHYAVLGVPMDASLTDVMRAYDKKSHQGGSAIREAWETLGDEERRYLYDFGRKLNPQASPKSTIAPNSFPKPPPGSKGDGVSQCLVCGFKASTERDKKVHSGLQGHAGFYDSKGNLMQYVIRGGG